MVLFLLYFLPPKFASEVGVAVCCEKENRNERKRRDVLDKKEERTNEKV